ncbi:MAG TPA: helix-turn-helix domain-containing protein [Casimicrobiaceae bacterium]|nr:helix-turn-helix domain-containing protein [Casimicrobiaceae bacterium]
MNDARRLVDALKQVVRLRGLTYAALAKRLGLSEASVKRLFSQGRFTLARLEQCCAAVDIDVLELARLAHGREGASAELTLAQETALAGDARLMAVFYLVVNGWTAAEIVERYQLSAVQCTGLLARLDRLGLIDLMPGDRVRLRVPGDVRLRPDGPIRRRHGKRALEDFLAPQFDRAGGAFAFEFRELSPASFEVLKRKLLRLADEIHQLADVDAHLPPAQRETIGVALGIRPWSMESAIELPARRPGPTAAATARPRGRAR